MKIQPVRRITAKYPDEWLLVQVSKADEETGEPLEGCLVLHSADRRTVRQRMLRCKGRHALIFTGPVLPKGMTAALYSL
jgi:hypothetical protein